MPKKQLSKSLSGTNFTDLFDTADDTFTIEPKEFVHANKNLLIDSLETVYNLMVAPDTADHVRIHAAKVIMSYAVGSPIAKTEDLSEQTLPDIRPIIIRAEDIVKEYGPGPTDREDESPQSPT